MLHSDACDAPPGASLSRMNESEYINGNCDACGGAIEFPTAAVGQATACPLCGQTTRMISASSAATSPPPPSRRYKPGVVAGSLCLIGIIAVSGVLLSRRGDKDIQTPVTIPNTPEKAAPTNLHESNAAAPTNAPVASNVSAAPRSLDDLKTGAITLEKAKNSSLIYAVGVLRNESEHQRFGVTVEVELKDARGNDAGTAKDYRAVIEPRQEWRFRALVLNSKASQGKIVRIREE